VSDDLGDLGRKLRGQRKVRTTPPSCAPESAELAAAGALGDMDLLALVAGRPKALSLLDRYGSLRTLAKLSPSALADAVEDKAIGLRLGAAFELGSRARSPAQALAKVSNSREVAALMTPLLGSLMHEEMWVLALDGRNRVRGQRRVAQGGLHGLSVHPSDILRGAIVEAASSIILVHNHPGGAPDPSPEDLAMTKRLITACNAVGVPLADHVIVTGGGAHTSLRDIGVISGD
jgi:DNA repair protein RadC